MSKKSFYCWYLGFTNAYGFQSPNRIYDLLQNIIKYQNEKSPTSNEPLSTPSKVTLRLSDDSLAIVDNKISGQQQAGRAGSAKSKDHYGSTKAYSISYDNITCVTRINHPNFADIVACIVRSNLNMDLTTGQNKLVLNMHAFRFDSEETAIKMEQYLNYYRKLYKKKYEKQVAKLKKKKSLYKSENNLVRSNSPSQNEHLFNNNLRNSFLKRTTADQHYGSRVLDNSSIGDGTRSSSSQNERDQSMASPISPNESFSSPLYQHENQYFARVPNPHYLTSTENDSSRFVSSFGQPDKTKPAKPAQVENLHREFSQKLKERQIFLFPAKDYLEERAEAKQKGANNLNTSSSNDVRYCLNESIVGSEAVRMREKNLKSSDSYENNSLSGSDLSSFREQADQVLKILDDAVEGIYLNPKDLNSNVFEYKPMENTSSSFSGSLQNLSEQPRLNKKYSASNESLFKSGRPAEASNSSSFMNQKSASAASGLNEPAFFNLSSEYGVVKKNPLHMIEEEAHQPVQVHKNAIQPSFNHVSNRGDDSYMNGTRNSDKPKHKMSFSNNNNNNNGNIKYSSAQSVQTPANVGFRNGVLTKLQGYQPQWMSGSFKQEQSSGNGYKKLAHEQSQHGEPARLGSSFRVVAASNEPALNDRSNVYMNGNQAKLKYSESARVNNSTATTTNVKQHEIKPSKSKTSNSSNNLFNQKMQNINDKLKNLQDGAHNEYYNETSQFILKPASSSYKSDSSSNNYKNKILVQDYNGKSSHLAGTYIDVNNFSKKTPYNNNNLNDFYNSNPALSLSNRLNDVYY